MKNEKLKIKNVLLTTIFLLGFIFASAQSAQAAIISNEELTTLTDNAFIVTWTTTDEKSSTEIQYGIGGYTSVVTVDGTTKYHYCQVSGLYSNTTYNYRVKSGSILGPDRSIKTLGKPTGDYLFTFAVMSDLRYADGKADFAGARGSPYSLCKPIISSEVANINSFVGPDGKGIAFTVVDGNIAESSGSYGDQVGSSSNLKGQLDKLLSASDLPVGSAASYLPTPGFQDKTATYTNNWITNAFKPLTTDPGTTESRYGYQSSDATTDSIFNYSFSYKYYNFVFADSVRNAGAGARINTDKIRDLITAEARKTFVFSSVPAYDFISMNDYPIPQSLIPSIEGGITTIDNDSAFRATLEAIKDVNNYPVVAALISGHITDNYKRDINNISYVRQGPAVQYPTGYSIYKVYTNGYIKSFYKTTGGSDEGSDIKPFYEYARDQITSTSSLGKDVLIQLYLGSNSVRNFTYSYPFIPGAPPRVSSTSPASGESKVPLNKPITITFNKRMSTSGISNWVTISPSAGSLTANFDSSRTILTVNHADFAVDQTYTVTVLQSQVKDEGLATMESDVVFTFDTNASTRDTTPPIPNITPLPNNTTTDILPAFFGVATDESGVANVEYRLDGGIWTSAEATDGIFNSTRETFTITTTTPLSRGTHLLELRTTDTAGNITTANFPSYSFTVAENKPSISVKINGVKPYPGDPLSSTPKVEITVTTIDGPATGQITFDNSTTALTFSKIDTNYYSTFEVTSALIDGIHGFTVEAFDASSRGATYEVYPLYVQSAQATIVQGVPLSYPNPFDPGSAPTLISYTLSKASNITLSIHDLSGSVIAKRNYSASASGGRAGYNAVSWDGKSDAGDYVGNGIYIYLIIADGTVAAKGKLTVLKR